MRKPVNLSVWHYYLTNLIPCALTWHLRLILIQFSSQSSVIFSVRSGRRLICLHPPELQSSAASLTSLPCPPRGLVERDSQTLGEREGKERGGQTISASRSCSLHAPNPLLSSTCHTLAAKWNWLLISPPCHRSVVVAGCSGLTASLGWDNRSGEEHEEARDTLQNTHTDTHTRSCTPS